VLVGAAANIKALAERARAILDQRGNLVIVCGGRDKQFALEDAYAAGRLIKVIRKGIRKLALNDAGLATVALLDKFAGWEEALEGPRPRSSSRTQGSARTSPSPPGRTALASSPCTRIAALHEPQGAPGADRYWRPRGRAVPRLTLLRLPITGSWGDRIGSLLWHVLGVGSVLLPSWASVGHWRRSSASGASRPGGRRRWERG